MAATCDNSEALAAKVMQSNKSSGVIIFKRDSLSLIMDII